MSDAKSVQFRSPEKVLGAYKNNQVPMWSIFQGKQGPMFKYQGDDLEAGYDLLEQVLTAIYQERSAAIYTFNVYEDLPKGKIKSDTPVDGSFNFRFFATTENSVLPNQYSHIYEGGAAAMVQDMQAMKVQMNLIANKLNEEEEESAMGIVGEILEHPAIEPIVPTVVNRLLDLFLPENTGTGELARVSGINVEENTQDVSVDELLPLLKRLQPKVKDLKGLLTQLCKLAETKPNKFNFYYGALMGMKL